VKEEELPNDIEELKKLIITKDNHIKNLEKNILELNDLIAHINKKRL
jgi:hypothetical protein